MKTRLPKILLTALLTGICSANAFAEIKADNIDYTLSDNGDGTYAASATIGDGVDINMAGGLYVKYIDEYVYQTNVHDVNISMTGGNISYILSAGNFRALPVSGDVCFDITGGSIQTLVGANNMSTALTPQYSIDYVTGKKLESVTINVGGDARVSSIIGGNSVSPDDGWPDADFVRKYATLKDITINVTDQAQIGKITGAGADYNAVEGNVTINIDGGSIGDIYAVGSGTVAGDVTVNLRNGEVTGDIEVGSGSVGGTTTLNVGTESAAYTGTVASTGGFDRIVIAKGSSLTAQGGNLFDTKEHTYTVGAANTSAAVVSTGGDIAADAPITLTILSNEKLNSGRYLLVDASRGSVDLSNWSADTVTVNGIASFEDLVWEGNVLTFIFRSPEVDNIVASNWGVFKSSQAFVGTLWDNNRTNAVEISPATADGKGGLQPAGRTLAWGTVYAQSARIGGVGADYSLWGGAIGVEHQFVSGRSIGAAVGYDWGTVSPFNSGDIDQESAHFGLYGRAAAWQVGQKGAITLDWSAAVGNTTSECDSISGDWDQNTLQLDARVSYLRSLSERTTGSVFAGLQYFAAEDATAGELGVSSMQNLRTEIGAELSYRATQKTTVYGEVSVYNDAMRHNPYVSDGGLRFEGTNPGRLGGSVSAGVNYQINDAWSLRGNYSFDAADDSTEHNVNVGAAYQF